MYVSIHLILIIIRLDIHGIYKDSLYDMWFLEGI